MMPEDKLMVTQADRFYIDCEFDGHGGALISFAVVAEEGQSLYLTVDEREAPVLDPWVRDNVLSVIDQYGDPDLVRRHVRRNEVGSWLRRFLGDCTHPIIVADSPVDIGRFCTAISTGEGGGWASADYPQMTFEVHNIDCYPTTLAGAIQHNAWWDAMALRHALQGSAAISATGVEGLLEAARNLLPYLRWTVSDESPGYHPTMPSAVGAFIAAIAKAGGQEA
jgi:hypothetical protein